MMNKAARNFLLGSAVLALSAGIANAQLFYAGVRVGAGIPTGKFAAEDGTILTGATPGLGYGLDAGIGAGPLGFYAGYDRIQFGCAGASCADGGKWKLEGYSAGVRAGVPLFPLLKPWAKAGLTYNDMTGSFPGSSDSAATTEKGVGYELGAGVDIPIVRGFFNLTPQVRYIRQNLEVSGVKRPANYYTFDIGLRLRSPI
jgi:opacity protein-like surface antigen